MHASSYQPNSVTVLRPNYLSAYDHCVSRGRSGYLLHLKARCSNLRNALTHFMQLMSSRLLFLWVVSYPMGLCSSDSAQCKVRSNQQCNASFIVFSISAASWDHGPSLGTLHRLHYFLVFHLVLPLQPMCVFTTLGCDSSVLIVYYCDSITENLAVILSSNTTCHYLTLSVGQESAGFDQGIFWNSSLV